MDKIESLVNKNEIRRLMKAAREKNIDHLIEWMYQFEEQMRQEYERAFQKELEEAINNFLITIAYSLRFSETTKFGKKRLNEFMDDLMVTIDMYRTGEYKPEEYKEALKKSGIDMFDNK